MNAREIFMNAPEDASPEELEKYLKEVCGDDQVLRNGVDALYEAVGQDTLFMEKPPLLVVENPSGSESSGSVIGKYELLDEIGEGGFGVVYRANQREPLRQVALKIIKQGVDRQVLARFKAELQTQAMMDHPNIAKIFDSGRTDSGRPFFVMELVHGVPIGQYCSEKKLSIRDRLTLFVEVCKGVQHAHQKGVIHRDLKPSNVLVVLHDGTPIPKVIDFGIAKATESSVAADMTLTRQGQTIGTPAYMSPEQASGGVYHIDTRSDIYSLGVMLYELLTGLLPFQPGTDFDEIRRQIKEDTPPRPSTRISSITENELGKLAEQFRIDPRQLRSTVRGDLDWIIMKALEKDQDRRYESATSLLDDLERYLNSEPVLASPPGLIYETSKFVNRHRSSVLAGAAGILLLLSLIGMGFYHAYREKLDDLNHLRGLEKELEQLTNAEDAGRRSSGLSKVAELAKLEASIEVRNSAIKCLTLLDIEAKPLSVWNGYPAGSRAIAFDQGFSRYGLCDADGVITVREAGTGDELLRLPGVFENVDRLLLAGAPDLLAIWSTQPGEDGETGLLEVWNFSKERLVFKQSVGSDSSAMDLSPNGQWIAYGIEGDSLEVRNLADPSRVYSHKLGRVVNRISFQPTTGKLLAIESSESHNLTFFNWRTGEQHNIYFPDLLADFAWHPSGEVICVSPKGSPLFLCAQGGDGRFGEKSRGPNAVGVYDVAFSADGSFLITSDSENMLKLWEPTTGKELVREIVPPEDKISGLSHSADSGYLGWSYSGTSIKFRGLASDTDVYTLPPSANLERRNTQALFDPSGRILFLTSDRGVRLFDWKNRRYLGVLELGEVDSIAWPPASDNIAILGNVAGGMRVQMIWNNDTLGAGALRFFDTPSLPDAAVMGATESFLSIATEQGILTFAPNGFFPSMESWGTQGSEIVAVAACPVNHRIAVVNRTQGVLQILDQQDDSWVEVRQLPLPGGKSAAFSPAGNLLFAGFDQGYHAYDTANWKRSASFPSSSLLSSAPIAIDPTGSYAASSVGRDSVALIRLASLKVVAHIPLRNGEPATSLTFSPSGAELAIAGRSQHAEVWNLAAIDHRLREYDLDWNHGLTATNDDPAPIIWSGLENVFANQTRENFEQMEATIASDPDANIKGQVFRKLREFGKAEAAYLEALEGQPANPDIMARIALTCLAQNRLDQALSHWNGALEIDPGYWAASTRLAQIYLLGPADLVKRKKDLGHQMVLDLKNADPPREFPESFEYSRYFAVASSLFRQGNYDSAMTAILNAQKIGTSKKRSMCDLFFLKAMCCYHLEEFTAAEWAYSFASEHWLLDPLKHRNEAQTRALRKEASKLLYHDLDGL